MPGPDSGAVILNEAEPKSAILGVPSPLMKIFSSLRRMVAEGSTLMMFALLMLLLTTLDTILLGIFSTADQVGEYGVASRLAMFISFVAFAANSVAEPQYARMYSQRQFGQIEVLVRKSEVFSLGTAMPLMVAFVVFGSDILASFGHAFRTAHSSLIILSVGHFLTLALAPAAGLLVMCNQSGAVRNAALVAVITNAGLNMLLVPSLGADGAAIATFCSVLVFHMVSAALVFKKLSLNPILGLPLRHQ